MTKTEISGIAPFFIVKDVPLALKFYRDHLGFDITLQGPSDDDIFFGIVQRGAAMIMLKDFGIDPSLTTHGVLKKVLPGGTLTCMYPILMRWQQNSPCAMCSFFNL